MWRAIINNINIPSTTTDGDGDAAAPTQGGD
jgi:hypothetical protein